MHLASPAAMQREIARWKKRAAFTAYQALARKKMFANATPKLVQSAKESKQKGFFVFLVK